MRVSLDFELEYGVANADQVARLEDAIVAAATEAARYTPAVKITKVTWRVAGFYPDQPLNHNTTKQDNRPMPLPTDEKNVPYLKPSLGPDIAFVCKAIVSDANGNIWCIDPEMGTVRRAVIES